MSLEVIQTKAETIRSKLYSYPTPPSLSVVIAAASLSKLGYLTRVKYMWLKNINLASVPHAACLGDIQVEDMVLIDNVTKDRYRDQVRRWAERIRWKVKWDNSSVIWIERQ